MKKQLIAVGLAGLLTIPTVSFGAEMAGPSLYGSFRTGLTFGSGDASVGDFGSRWGFKGSHEVAEGLTASYKYESKFNTTNAESSGGVGHPHDKDDAIAGRSEIFAHTFGTASSYDPVDEDGVRLVDDMDVELVAIDHVAFAPGESDLDMEDGNVAITEIGTGRFATTTTLDDPLTTQDEANVVYYRVIHSQRSGYGVNGTAGNAAITSDGGPGGRLSYISLSGGFGTITLGYIWSASYNHYGAALDPTWFNGSAGGASARIGNAISYSSSAGDVSFQIDKVTGVDEMINFGASADLGPIGVRLGYWSNANDDASFTGVALKGGAGGVGLAVGLGSEDNAWGVGTDTSIISLSGALGDSGISYGVQVTNSEDDAGSQNLVSLVNTLGPGATIHFEHLDPGVGDASSHIALRVDF